MIVIRALKPLRSATQQLQLLFQGLSHAYKVHNLHMDGLHGPNRA